MKSKEHGHTTNRGGKVKKSLEKRWEALKEKCKTCEFCERYVSQGKEYQACGGCPEYVKLEEQRKTV